MAEPESTDREQQGQEVDMSDEDNFLAEFDSQESKDPQESAPPPPDRPGESQEQEEQEKSGDATKAAEAAARRYVKELEDAGYRQSGESPPTSAGDGAVSARQEMAATSGTPPPTTTSGGAPAASPGVRLTREMVERNLGLLQDDDLIPDGDFFIGDTQVDLRRWKDEFPEAWYTTKIVGAEIARSIAGKQIEQERASFQKELNSIKDDVRRSMEANMFWIEMLQDHPDAFKINQSKDFNEWLAQQPEHIKLYAASPVAKHGSQVMSAYKEQMAGNAAMAHDDAARASKKNKDDLHRGSLRGPGGRTPRSGNEFEGLTPEEEFNQAFFSKED